MFNPVLMFIMSKANRCNAKFTILTGSTYIYQVYTYFNKNCQENWPGICCPFPPHFPIPCEMHKWKSMMKKKFIDMLHNTGVLELLLCLFESYCTQDNQQHNGLVKYTISKLFWFDSPRSWSILHAFGKRKRNEQQISYLQKWISQKNKRKIQEKMLTCLFGK